MKTLPPERRNPQLATAEGSEGENTRDCTSDVGIMIALSFLTHQYRAKISLAYVAGVLRVPDRNSRDDARLSFNQAKLLISALAGKYLHSDVNSGTWCHAVGRTWRSLKTRADKGYRQIHRFSR